MRKFYYLAVILSLFLLFVFLSCDKNSDNSKCNVSNPVEELGWLKSEIEEIENRNDDLSRYVFIKIAKYRGENVIVYGNCHPAALSVPLMKSCTGEILGSTFNFYDELTDIKVLWKHKESQCNLSESDWP